MRKARFIVASLVALALVAVACGDNKSSTTSAPTTKAATTATTAGGAAATVATCKVDRAMKLVGLAEKPPEGPNAIPDYANGWDLAVTQINDKGGSSSSARPTASVTSGASSSGPATPARPPSKPTT